MPNMPKQKSPTTELASLYDALEIPQKGNVPCFGHIEFGNACRRKRNHRKDKIRSTLHGIIDTMEDGATADSADVRNLLMRLARWLTCSRMDHDHLVYRRRRVYSKHQYVAFVLYKRLRHRDGYSDDETPESTRSNKPTRLPPCHKQAESSDDEHEYVEDGDEDYDTEYWEDEYEDEDEEEEEEEEESGNDSEDEQESEEGSDEDNEAVSGATAERPTTSCRQRPKLNRETAMINKSAFVTPTKQCGRPSRNLQPSTPRMRQLVDGLGSLSVMDDAWTPSPESVISPGVSRVFSPVSTASTPMSIPDSELRPHRSRCLRSEEESPTRWGRAANRGPLSGLSRTLAYGNATTTTSTREKSSRKGYKQLEPSLLLDNQDSDSERQTDDQEVFEEQPASKGAKTSLSPGVREMRFDPINQHRNPVKALLTLLYTNVGKETLKAGWVYCFAEKTAPGYLKIGYRRYKDDNGKTTLSLEDQDDTAQVMKRIQKWEKGCRHNVDYKFICYMPCAAERMERLVHAALHKSKQKARCPNPACEKTHVEWFKVSEGEARRAVEVWQQFSKLMPYPNNGRLRDFWHSRTCGDPEDFRDWPIKKWVHERWARVIVPAVVECEDRIAQLQEKQTQLAKRRRETQERKEKLESEIESLRQDEKDIQEELAELQNQH